MNPASLEPTQPSTTTPAPITPSEPHREELNLSSEQALSSFYDRWVPEVYPLIVGILRDEGTGVIAEDVVEATFWQAWQQAASYDPEKESVSDWILNIARTKATEKVRARGMEPPADLSVDTTHVINRGRSAGIKSRLLSKAAADRDNKLREKQKADKTFVAVRPQPHRAPEPKANPTPVRSAPPAEAHAPASTAGNFNWLALIAGLLFVITGVQLWHVTNDRNELRDTLAGRDSETAAKLQEVEEKVADRDKALASVTGHDVRTITLTNWSAQGATVARMYWNRSANTWTLITYSIRQPKPGATFQAWLNTGDRKIPIGTFTPDSTGHGMLQATYPLERNSLNTVTVTEEPAGGSAEPTGAAVIAGSPY